jgi:hypothetical protein
MGLLVLRILSIIMSACLTSSNFIVIWLHLPASIAFVSPLEVDISAFGTNPIPFLEKSRRSS